MSTTESKRPLRSRSMSCLFFRDPRTRSGSQESFLTRFRTNSWRTNSKPSGEARKSSRRSFFGSPLKRTKKHVDNDVPCSTSVFGSNLDSDITDPLYQLKQLLQSDANTQEVVDRLVWVGGIVPTQLRFCGAVRQLEESEEIHGCASPTISSPTSSPLRARFSTGSPRSPPPCQHGTQLAGKIIDLFLEPESRFQIAEALSPHCLNQILRRRDLDSLLMAKDEVLALLISNSTVKKVVEEVWREVSSPSTQPVVIERFGTALDGDDKMDLDDDQPRTPMRRQQSLPVGLDSATRALDLL